MRERRWVVSFSILSRFGAVAACRRERESGVASTAPGATRTTHNTNLRGSKPHDAHNDTVNTQVALAVGFGADGVCPRVAYEALAKLRHDGLIHAKMRNDIPSPDDVPDDAEIRKAYRKALAKGLLKVMSKMGISTLQSYKGAQIFEALGLHPDVVETCFSGTPSRIGGASFDAIQRDVVALHDHAWGSETRKRQTDPAGAWTGVNHEDVRSRRFEVLRCLHFVDVTRI